MDVSTCLGFFLNNCILCCRVFGSFFFNSLLLGRSLLCNSSHQSPVISHQIATDNIQPYTANRQPSAVHIHQPAFSHTPSAIIHQPLAPSHQSPATSLLPSAFSHQPSAINHQPLTVYHQCSAFIRDNHYPSSVNRQP